MRPDLKRALFSEFVQKLEGQQQAQDTRSGMEIVKDLKTMIKNRVKKRKEGR